ncbi:hypothetical protein QLQ12_43200 [Actinoplanes sp. NEAU-A12]|uniref:Secreted protein n=1 Tax=Actinoplanes sandaracinus TaxID=3045177 RepID=A0ABT6X0N2_9ACTN|nr:hypothetical protein [Actinoplanes sandaracinus]MDI6105411.1 hypothetical protein [Actinoplanes sandaracinus]
MRAVATAVAGVLTGLALVVPGSTAAAATAEAPIRMVATASQVEPGEVGWNSWTQENGNFSARCRKSESYFTAKYNGAYKLYVRLHAGRADDFSEYEEIRANSIYYSNALHSGRTGYGDYIRIPSQSSIATDATGVMGIKVYDADSGEYLWSHIWNFNLHCGYDYTVVISDF